MTMEAKRGLNAAYGLMALAGAIAPQATTETAVDDFCGLVDSTVPQPAAEPAERVPFLTALGLELVTRVFGRLPPNSGGIRDCATCTRTISANKRQCRACSDMSEFLLLVLSRKPGTPTSIPAEMRIAELAGVFVEDKPRVQLMMFAQRLTKPKYSLREIFEGINTLLPVAIYPYGTAEALVKADNEINNYEIYRADDDGMAHA